MDDASLPVEMEMINAAEQLVEEYGWSKAQVLAALEDAL